MDVADRASSTDINIMTSSNCPTRNIWKQVGKLFHKLFDHTLLLCLEVAQLHIQICEHIRILELPTSHHFFRNFFTLRRHHRCYSSHCFAGDRAIFTVVCLSGVLMTYIVILSDLLFHCVWSTMSGLEGTTMKWKQHQHLVTWMKGSSPCLTCVRTPSDTSPTNHTSLRSFIGPRGVWPNTNSNGLNPNDS